MPRAPPIQSAIGITTETIAPVPPNCSCPLCAGGFGSDVPLLEDWEKCVVQPQGLITGQTPRCCCVRSSRRASVDTQATANVDSPVMWKPEITFSFFWKSLAIVCYDSLERHLQLLAFFSYLSISLSFPPSISAPSLLASK